MPLWYILPVHLVYRLLHFTAVAVSKADEHSSYDNLFSFETAVTYCSSRS